MRHHLVVSALALLMLAPAARAAGQLEVKFVAPEQFADIGRGSVDVARNLQTLQAHFQSLARRLPDDRTLRLEVLDVDLAGELYPFRGGQDIRVLKGRADWPSMKLRYTLSAGGQVLLAGEETLTDMNYLSGSGGLRPDGPLAHDLRMVDRWFAERIVARKTAAR